MNIYLFPVIFNNKAQSVEMLLVACSAEPLLANNHCKYIRIGNLSAKKFPSFKVDLFFPFSFALKLWLFTCNVVSSISIIQCDKMSRFWLLTSTILYRWNYHYTVIFWNVRAVFTWIYCLPKFSSLYTKCTIVFCVRFWKSLDWRYMYPYFTFQTKVKNINWILKKMKHIKTEVCWNVLFVYFVFIQYQ